MKPITADWLKSAATDLETIDVIAGNSNLTAIVAFHAQQCVEKCLKAILEEFDIDVRKTHNLLVLKTAVEKQCSIGFDEDILSLLNKLYIDSRYPGAFGLLPTGAPDAEEANEFAQFAKGAMVEAVSIINNSLQS